MILLFVGAGGSAAVDAEQYPTTVEFFKRLPDNIVQSRLFFLVRNFLTNAPSHNGASIDIEKILWELDNLQDYLMSSISKDCVEGWFIWNDYMATLDGRAIRSPDYADGFKKIVEDYVEPLRKDINDLVHEFYVRRPGRDKLVDWKFFLRGLEAYGPNIEIFTTNYDLVLESAIEKAVVKIETGRASGLQTTLDTTLWDRPGATQGTKGRLTKLHGSVDWQLGDNSITCSDVYTGDPQKQSILYPGFKGPPTKEPFIKFHEHLRAVVDHADAAAFIGFAFRDEYINGILSNLRAEIPKCVICKDAQQLDVPFSGRVVHFGEGFSKESISRCMEVLKGARTSSSFC